MLDGISTVSICAHLLGLKIITMWDIEERGLFLAWYSQRTKAFEVVVGESQIN